MEYNRMNDGINWLINQSVCQDQCRSVSTPIILAQQKVIIILSVIIIGLSVISLLKRKEVTK